MNRNAFVVAAMMLALSGCAAERVLTDDMVPEQAVMRAAQAAPHGVPGSFRFRVQATGRQDGRLFLNSEADYRDQRNLSVAVLPAAQVGLESRFGTPLDTVLKGRDIRVDGEAMRVRIDFTADGAPTGKYYYQTHVVVRHADQITPIN
ncbi:hypothetical protein SAMN05192583_2593 [Sphingomonas gellani]|uniref:DUF4426 domain-containing protein n=1 Tax=Sphingomonas gellani TaxID=1166340 RepID=A0A1H8FX21_9SPHN|nr:hypothetical protein [Sphingomonas gellani]SEN35777.1 hypothetical protein SAMN05192583_2593 [Sphingomonas gellani]